jgi:hypothetical protein
MMYFRFMSSWLSESNLFSYLGNTLAAQTLVDAEAIGFKRVFCAPDGFAEAAGFDFSYLVLSLTIFNLTHITVVVQYPC